MTQPVDELHGLTEHTLLDAVSQHTTPFVVRGIATHWPLVRAALQSNETLLSALRAQAKDVPVNAMTVSARTKGRIFYNESLTGFNFQQQRRNFPDLIDLVQKSVEDLPAKGGPAKDGPAEHHYLGSVPVDYCLPGFKHQHGLNLDALSPMVSLWFGNRSVIAAHYDIPDNFACVVAGRRRFTLFPPEQIDNLYIGPIDLTPAGQAISLVDFQHPDLSKYPKFTLALRAALAVELEPGDGIFIPSLWWHHVEGLEPINLLINYWWRNLAPQAAAPQAALYQALLSLRSLPEHQRKGWRALFDHYVFNEQETSHIPAEARGILGSLDENHARKLRALIRNNS